MNQNKMIEKYSSDLTKVIESFGADSDAVVAAFFRLQAARMGKPITEFFDWVRDESEKIEEESKKTFLEHHSI